MIATLNGSNLMVGNMRVASIHHSPKGFKWQAIFGGGRTGRKAFPTFAQAIRACAKSCGLTVRVPSSWEDIKVEFDDDCPKQIRFMVDRFAGFIGSESIYGEDAILDAMRDHLIGSTYVVEHKLYIHRGGHHVAICAGNDRLAMITAEDTTL